MRKVLHCVRRNGKKKQLFYVYFVNKVKRRRYKREQHEKHNRRVRRRVGSYRVRIAQSERDNRAQSYAQRVQTLFLFSAKAQVRRNEEFGDKHEFIYEKFGEFIHCRHLFFLKYNR